MSIILGLLSRLFAAFLSTLVGCALASPPTVTAPSQKADPVTTVAPQQTQQNNAPVSVHVNSPPAVAPASQPTHAPG